MAHTDDTGLLQSHLQSLVFDQKHMTARGLRVLRQKTGIDEFNLAVLFTGLATVYLLAGEEAQTLANSILTITPILLTYVYPAEKPPTPHLLIYWSAFGVLTIFDSNFESKSGYYFFKVLILALLFLHPFDGADRILWHIRSMNVEADKDEAALAPLTEEELALIKQQNKHRSAMKRKAEVSDSEKELDGSISSQSYSNGGASDANPMLHNSHFRIDDLTVGNIDSLSTNYNPHDLAFEPTKNLVFNGPFDYENLTYFIRIRNTSTKHIAFAIKSNAIPRVLAAPPCGILPPKHKRDIAVILKKIDSFDPSVVENDRLAFEYVFCPPETEKFKFKLLQVTNLIL